MPSAVLAVLNERKPSPVAKVILVEYHMNENLDLCIHICAKSKTSGHVWPNGRLVVNGVEFSQWIGDAEWLVCWHLEQKLDQFYEELFAEDNVRGTA